MAPAPQGLTYTWHHTAAADLDKLVEPVSVDDGINHQPASPPRRAESLPLLTDLAALAAYASMVQLWKPSPI